MEMEPAKPWKGPGGVNETARKREKRPPREKGGLLKLKNNNNNETGSARVKHLPLWDVLSVAVHHLHDCEGKEVRRSDGTGRSSKVSQQFS